MGSTQSKIENEEAVNRCKDRKKFMKDAVSARNAFAAAHFAYAMSLKNTGAALSDYAQGEVQHARAVSSSTPPPPPPLPNFPPFPLQRAASMPKISVHKPDPKRSEPIFEEENEEEIDNESHNLKHRSSRSSGGGGGGSRGRVSEGLAPPISPPRTPPHTDRTLPPPPPESKGMSSWDFFFPSMENVPGPSLAEVDDGRIEREEMERKMNQERAKRADDGRGGGRRRSGKAEVAEVVVEEEEEEEKVAELLAQPPPPTKAAKKVKQVAPAEVPVDLLHIFSMLDDCFLKAAHAVSNMLEAHRLRNHSNFADNRGHIDHSARAMRVVTWNRSFRGLPNAGDGMDESDSEEHKTHATVLDKMLAWEKKLYDEVKTGEQMKFEYQRKVASLNKLKKRGATTDSIEKTKAALSHLHTRYIVDMQSMDSNVSEISRLRDEQLYPILVALVDGMATMWENMKIHHEKQSKIVAALKNLDISQSLKDTSEHHHERIVQLWASAQEWHSQLEILLNHQKEYIRALNSWLKLNLVLIDNNLKEKVSSPQRPQNPPIQALLHAWHDSLEKLPDEHAKTAISNFAAVIDTIVQYHVDDMKLREKCEETRKDVVHKARQFEDWYYKYMQCRIPPDEMDSERAPDKDHVAERQFAVKMVMKKLEEEVVEYQRQRDKSLNALITRLPELFRAMSDFSGYCSNMYLNLRSISQPRKPSESS